MTFIDNPRRHPRVPVRLRVKVVQRGEDFQAETEDMGPGGCLLVSQRPLGTGLPLRLAIGCDGLAEKLLVLGHVAWHEARERLRSGISFDSRQSGSIQPKWWFEQMIAAQPGVAARLGPVPSRLSLDGPLYLLPPPRHILDLSPDEVRTLSGIDNGVTVRALLERWPDRAQATQRALFGLFEKRALTLSLGGSAPAWQWREALSRMEEEGGTGPVPPSAPLPPAAPPLASAWVAPVLEREPARGPATIAASAPAAGVAPVPARGPVPGPPPIAASTPAAGVAPVIEREPAPRPPTIAASAPAAGGAPVLEREPAARPFSGAPASAGAGRQPGRPREAQRCLDRARELERSGQIHGAIALLRRALEQSPKDAEIAQLLGSLAFRGRRN